MASPHSESFYCIPKTSLSSAERNWYGGLSIGVAALSFIGSSYTAHTWGRQLKRTKMKVRNQLVANPHIVFFLAIADLIASCAVIGRGTALISIEPPKLTNSNLSAANCSLGSPHNCRPYETYYLYFGVPLEIALRFGFVATYAWTLFYAIDVYLKSKQMGLKPSRYHAISWTAAAVFTAINETVLFVDVGVPCAGRPQLIGSYLCMYIPMIIVIVANPILYVLSSRNFTRNVKARGTFTNTERQAIREQKIKFLLMLTIFYICWLPSIVSGFYTVTKWHVPIEVYILNALCNPSQGFLNSFAYSRTVVSTTSGGTTTTTTTTSSTTATARKKNFVDSEYYETERVTTDLSDQPDDDIAVAQTVQRETSPAGENCRPATEEDPLITSTAF
ncbi:G-protein coupled receptor 143-like [Oscarella lobularis]|uniref:G-protein coupled receptor 143-like n=1 Tax=Oscarella lobularis TaxID=121494 RepID=UPI0033142602